MSAVVCNIPPGSEPPRFRQHCSSLVDVCDELDTPLEANILVFSNPTSMKKTQNKSIRFTPINSGTKGTLGKALLIKKAEAA